MADLEFLNSTDTNLKDDLQVNVTDPSVKAVTFTGFIGTTMAIFAQHGVTPVLNGEVTVTGASASTSYTAFKGANGRLAIYKNPPI